MSKVMDALGKAIKNFDLSTKGMKDDVTELKKLTEGTDEYKKAYAQFERKWKDPQSPFKQLFNRLYDYVDTLRTRFKSRDTKVLTKLYTELDIRHYEDKLDFVSIAGHLEAISLDVKSLIDRQVKFNNLTGLKNLTPDGLEKRIGFAAAREFNDTVDAAFANFAKVATAALKDFETLHDQLQLFLTFWKEKGGAQAWEKFKNLNISTKQSLCGIVEPFYKTIAHAYGDYKNNLIQFADQNLKLSSLYTKFKNDYVKIKGTTGKKSELINSAKNTFAKHVKTITSTMKQMIPTNRKPLQDALSKLPASFRNDCFDITLAYTGAVGAMDDLLYSLFQFVETNVWW